MDDSEYYYKILGLDKSATKEDIKKAYHKLARIWHPDKNHGDSRAKNKFEEISEAYQILIDPTKKKLYDKEKRKDIFKPTSFMDPFRLFRNIFKDSFNFSPSLSDALVPYSGNNNLFRIYNSGNKFSSINNHFRKVKTLVKDGYTYTVDTEGKIDLNKKKVNIIKKIKRVNNKTGKVREKKLKELYKLEDYLKKHKI